MWMKAMMAAGLVLASAAPAQPLSDGAHEATAPVVRGVPYTMPRSDVRILTSRAGARYRILIAWPEAPPPPQGYPVLYLLDGDESFAVAAEAATRFGPYWGLAPSVVVAIGYPGPSRRTLDYTPAGPADVALPPGSGPSGGAEAFLAFLADELQPSIAADFPVDRDRQTLMGYSLGGLLALQAAFERPALFRTIIAAGPSIWYGDRRVLTGLAGLADRLREAGGRRRLVLTVGQYEQTPPPGMEKDPAWLKIAALSAHARMVDNARDLAARLAPFEQAGLDVDFRVIADGTHANGNFPAIREALVRAFAVRP